jgi:hypothetical protein
MLFELKKLNIINEGYKRIITLDTIFINPTHIISVRSYDGARDFLLSEGASDYSKNDYSLIKMNNINGTEEIIALGTSREIMENLKNKTQKRLLNG